MATPKTLFYNNPNSAANDSGFSKEYAQFLFDADIQDVDGWIDFVMFSLGYGQ
jgi:hypothetical protein